MDAHPLTVTPAVSFADCLTYEFGVRLDPETEAVAAAQISKARKLYNDLVAVMRETVDAIRTFENEKGGESAQLLQREIDELTELFRQAKALDDQDALKRIAQRRLEKWRLLGDMLKGVRIAHRAEIRERFLSKIGRKATCETYALRSMSVKDGLGWATANTVHESALLAFKKSFTLGKSPGFARGNEIDQDCLTLQFTDAGGSSAQAILEGRNAELALIPSNGCGRRKYGEFKFRLGSAKDGLYATGTWQYHRPIPDGSRITIARLVRRRLGLKYRWAIQLIVKPPSPVTIETSNRRPLATLHFGWALDTDGRHVAAIADSADPGEAQIVTLPASVEEGLRRAADIQANRDTTRDEIAVKVKSLDFPAGKSEQLDELVSKLKQSSPHHISANRLHFLCRLLRDVDALPGWLDAWRRDDKLLWQDQVHIAKRSRNARKNFYRQIAIGLARQYDAIAIEPLNLDAAAKKVDQATGEKTEFAKKARAGRVVAALYELESAVRWAASKGQCAVFELTGRTTSRCAICGGETHSDNESHQVLNCGDCGAELDRKRNGAVVAWQFVSQAFEAAVEDFWLTFVAQNAERKEKKAEKLEKLAESRRASVARAAT